MANKTTRPKAFSEQETRVHGIALPGNDIQILRLNLTDCIILKNCNIIGIAHINRKISIAYAAYNPQAFDIMQALFPDFELQKCWVPEGLTLMTWDKQSPFGEVKEEEPEKPKEKPCPACTDAGYINSECTCCGGFGTVPTDGRWPFEEFKEGE